MTKEELINTLSDIIQNYIIQYYPIEKQISDEQQKDCYAAYLLSIKLNKKEDTTLNDIIQISLLHANDILENNLDINDIISQYPEDERFYWEQLIKAQVRKIWVVRNVYQYTKIKNEINNLSSDNIDNYYDYISKLQVSLIVFPNL
jgi:hypothetical protein